jgi:hypothetical protein
MGELPAAAKQEAHDEATAPASEHTWKDTLALYFGICWVLEDRTS